MVSPGFALKLDEERRITLGAFPTVEDAVLEVPMWVSSPFHVALMVYEPGPEGVQLDANRP